MYVSEHLKWRILIAQALKSFHFERAGRFGERNEGVPLAAGTSVDKQYFHNCGYFMQK